MIDSLKVIDCANDFESSSEHRLGVLGSLQLSYSLTRMRQQAAFFGGGPPDTPFWFWPHHSQIASSGPADCEAKLMLKQSEDPYLATTMQLPYHRGR